MRLPELYKNQLVRYGFVAGMNVIASYGVFAFLIFLNLHYIFASTIATVFGILFGFKTFSTLVFDNKDNQRIFRYLIVWAAVYLLNVAGLAVFNHFKVSNYLAGFVMLLPCATTGFLLNRNFTFRQPKRLDNI